jgi:hypothetical protein
VWGLTWGVVHNFPLEISTGSLLHYAASQSRETKSKINKHNLGILTCGKRRKTNCELYLRRKK